MRILCLGLLVFVVGWLLIVVCKMVVSVDCCVDVCGCCLCIIVWLVWV